MARSFCSRMSSVTLQVAEDGDARDAPEQQQVPTFTWRHVLKRTWVHLAVALAIFACSLGIALYLHSILGRWERDNVHTIYRRYAEMLASTLQSQIDLFQVRRERDASACMRRHQASALAPV